MAQQASLRRATALQVKLESLVDSLPKLAKPLVVLLRQVEAWKARFVFVMRLVDPVDGADAVLSAISAVIDFQVMPTLPSSSSVDVASAVNIAYSAAATPLAAARVLPVVVVAEAATVAVPVSFAVELVAPEPASSEHRPEES